MRHASMWMVGQHLSWEPTPNEGQRRPSNPEISSPGAAPVPLTGRPHPFRRVEKGAAFKRSFAKVLLEMQV
jgi:hypothetical protein